MQNENNIAESYAGYNLGTACRHDNIAGEPLPEDIEIPCGGARDFNAWWASSKTFNASTESVHSSASTVTTMVASLVLSARNEPAICDDCVFGSHLPLDVDGGPIAALCTDSANNIVPSFDSHDSAWPSTIPAQRACSRADVYDFFGMSLTSAATKHLYQDLGASLAAESRMSPLRQTTVPNVGSTTLHANPNGLDLGGAVRGASDQQGAGGRGGESFVHAESQASGFSPAATGYDWFRSSLESIPDVSREQRLHELLEELQAEEPQACVLDAEWMS